MVIAAAYVHGLSPPCIQTNDMFAGTASRHLKDYTNIKSFDPLHNT